MLKNAEDLQRAVKNTDNGTFPVLTDKHPVTNTLADQTVPGNIQVVHGSRALLYAVEQGFGRCVELLLTKGASTNTAREDYKTVLGIATEKGFAFIVKQLLNHGVAIQDVEKRIATLTAGLKAPDGMGTRGLTETNTREYRRQKHILDMLERYKSKYDAAHDAVKRIQLIPDSGLRLPLGVPARILSYLNVNEFPLDSNNGKKRKVNATLRQ